MGFFSNMNSNYENIEQFQVDHNTEVGQSTAAINVVLIFFWLIFILIWIVSGVLMSIVCIFYKGSVSDKFLGYIIATSLGPLYWLYYIYNSNYCLKFDQPNYNYQQSEIS
jgi:hypothetical protein